MNKNNFLFILLLLGLNGCVADSSAGMASSMMLTMQVIFCVSLGLAFIGLFGARFSRRSGRVQSKNIVIWAVLIGLIVLLIA